MEFRTEVVTLMSLVNEGGQVFGWVLSFFVGYFPFWLGTFLFGCVLSFLVGYFLFGWALSIFGWVLSFLVGYFPV
jgi:hypothetical protein